MSIKLEKKITLMAAIALVFNLGLNLILIPRYAHIGAAVVTSLTELLLLCLSISFTPRSYLPIKSLVTGAKSLLASLVMSLALWRFLDLNIFFILPLAIVTYVATILLLGAVPREDFSALLSAVRQKATGSSASHALSEEGHEKMLERTMLLADEDTIPMKAVYRLQQIHPNIDLEALEALDTLPLKAVTPHQRTRLEAEDTLLLEGVARQLRARLHEKLAESERLTGTEEREKLSLKTTALLQEVHQNGKLAPDESPAEKGVGEMLLPKTPALAQEVQQHVKLAEDVRLIQNDKPEEEEEEDDTTLPMRAVKRAKQEAGM